MVQEEIGYFDIQKGKQGTRHIGNLCTSIGEFSSGKPRPRKRQDDYRVHLRVHLDTKKVSVVESHRRSERSCSRSLHTIKNN